MSRVSDFHIEGMAVAFRNLQSKHANTLARYETLQEEHAAVLAELELLRHSHTELLEDVQLKEELGFTIEEANATKYVARVAVRAVAECAGIRLDVTQVSWERLGNLISETTGDGMQDLEDCIRRL